MDNRDKYIGQILDNRYEILEVIGTGGMAVVYKALCHRLNRLVAVKILKDELAVDDDFRRRFHTESQAVAMLSHPNIVAVYDVSRSSDVEYIVMELIEGITLKQYIQRKGLLNWKESLHFATQITKALSHAHSRGIVHRDIKPHNIMILRDGSVKVADFGIARLQSTQQSTLTQEALGSVHYISPEQAKGSHVDERSDLYSVGVVMYEMLTNRLPFEGDSAVSVAIQHISSIPLTPREINPDIPTGLETITMHAMNPNLDDRYSSADEMLEDLEEFRKNPEIDFNYSPSVHSPGLVTERERGGIMPAAVRDRSLPIVQNTGKIPIEMTREQYIKNSRRSRRVASLTGILLIAVFMIVIVVFLWNFWLKGIFSEAETITVPDFVGKSYEAVIANTDYTNVYNIIPTYAPSDEVDEGHIISQDPIAGRSVVQSSERINLEVIVSTGKEFVVVPNLVNMENRQAKIDLDRLDLKYEITTVSSDTVTEGYIISTIPIAGEELLPGETVYLTVSGGPKIIMVEVPTLTGISLEVAKSRIESVNLTVGDIREVEDSSASGTVIFQSVPAGTEVPEHSVVNLQVSLGPAEVNVRVPSVVGFSEQTAVEKLESAGLVVGSVGSSYSEFPSGLVFNQSIEAGTEVPEGTVINIFLSVGPAPVSESSHPGNGGPHSP